MKSLFVFFLSCMLAHSAEIAWRDWDPKIFSEASKEHRLVLLDLGAGWCHWCHVMDRQTYSDPEVIRLIGEKFIAVKADQDSRPDFSNRYEDYGWPATVVFAVDGSEIVKRQGYLPPAEMISMLKAIILDPTPGPSVGKNEKIELAKNTFLSQALREKLEASLRSGYDPKLGGWGSMHKYLDAENVEYCLVVGAAHKASRLMADQTLSAGLQLIDPVWGGVYQYSAEGDWKHPHFEKIMEMQAANMRIYALAYGLEKKKEWLESALSIHRYLRGFLTSPDGAFYTSQDADLIPGQHAAAYFALDEASRRHQGVPHIDQNIYARENGLAITALVILYEATADKTYLQEAERAVKWIVKNRFLTGGGFRHGDQDRGGPFLGDTLSMGNAFLSLYEATGNHSWLVRASAAAQFMNATFSTADAGGFACVGQTQPQFDENVQMVRFANILFHYTDEPSQRMIAERAMRFLATPAIAEKRHAFVGGLLLADQELATDPIHIVVTGDKNDVATQSLFATASSLPLAYKRIEQCSPGSSKNLPLMHEPAAFLCTANTCSAPVADTEKLKLMLHQITAQK